MAIGPTQNYDDASLGVWKGRPILASATRALIAVVPLALTVGFGLAAVHWFPPRRLGVNPWIWLLAEMVCATVVLVLATRLGRKFVPLTTLLRLSLYFPDRAPSRLVVAMNHYSPDVLQARLGFFRRGLRPEDGHAAQILDLVAAISDHDPLTRGHSERVQAYSALIGKELGLSAQEAAKLSWAALLHDVGKLRIPASVLSSPGHPSTEEWATLAGHPEAGMEIAQPLREWLGPWLDVIGQHHERWDGAGYPGGLAGAEISRGARIVAVADAYDVITSARSYKRALPASAARAELARCAGEQFDPQVVRAFLAIGLGNLHRVAGPLSILSILPVLPSFAADLPSVVQRLTTVGALKSTGAISLVLTVSTATAGGLSAGVLSALEPPAAVPADSAATGTTQPGLDQGAVPPTVPPGASVGPHTTPQPHVVVLPSQAASARAAAQEPGQGTNSGVGPGDNPGKNGQDVAAEAAEQNNGGEQTGASEENTGRVEDNKGSDNAEDAGAQTPPPRG